MNIFKVKPKYILLINADGSGFAFGGFGFGAGAFAAALQWRTLTGVSGIMNIDQTEFNWE